MPTPLIISAIHDCCSSSITHSPPANISPYGGTMINDDSCRCGPSCECPGCRVHNGARRKSTTRIVGEKPPKSRDCPDCGMCRDNESGPILPSLPSLLMSLSPSPPSSDNAFSPSLTSPNPYQNSRQRLSHPFVTVASPKYQGINLQHAYCRPERSPPLFSTPLSPSNSLSSTSTLYDSTMEDDGE